MTVAKFKYGMSVGLVLLALCGLSGCAAMAAGAMAGGGTYAYISGWGTQVYNVELDEAYDAAIDACEALDLTLGKRERHLSDAEIEAMDGDTSVWIDLESTGVRVTEIAVRVGVVGDKIASERVHDRISKELQ